MNRMTSFVKQLRQDERSENTIRNYVSDLNNFYTFMGVPQGEGVSVVTQKDVRKYRIYLEKQGAKPATINRRLQALRTFFAFLQKKGIVNANPASEVKTKSIAKQNETKWLERYQVKAIFEAIDRQERSSEYRSILQRVILSVLVNCGLRVQELCDLKLDDLDFDRGIMVVYSGKGAKYRQVPLNKATERALRKWFIHRKTDGEYVFHSERSPKLTPRAVQHMMDKLSKELPFRFTPHQLRHTALHEVAVTTGRIEIVASVAGHDQIQTSKRYIEPSMKEIVEAMKMTEMDY